MHKKRLTLMKRLSPIMQPTIQEYEKIKHKKENTSVLDIISLWTLPNEQKHTDMKHIDMKNEMELRSPLDMQMSRRRFITYHHHLLSLSLPFRS